MLARAQLGHGGAVACPAGEMEAAQPLHGDDRPVEQRPGGGLDVVPGLEPARRLAPGVHERHARAALRTGVGLRVEAPVAGVLVLGPAGRAHLEAGHRGVRPVVGDVSHDREARPAVGAVGERVAKAAVGGIEQLGEAVGAGGAVGRNRGARLPVARALADREAELAGVLERLGHHAFDVRQRRRLRGQPLEEALDRLRRRLDLHHHAARVVVHVARHAELAREAIDVGAKADALDRALHPRANATQAASSRST